MKVTLESTDRVVNINGLPARVWQGTTESGIECHAFVTRIAVHKDLDASQFERELREVTPLRPELVDAIPLRMVL